MSVTIVQPAPDAAATERWRQWRIGYDESSRKAFRQMSVIAGCAMLAVIVNLVFELLSRP